MIENMLKLRMIMHRDDREKVLDSLQDVGVVHVESKNATAESAQAADEVKPLRDALAVLKDFSARWKPNLPATAWQSESQDLVKEIGEYAKKVSQLGEKLQELRFTREALEPWGPFDPTLLAELERQRLRIVFCSVARSRYVKLPLFSMPCIVINDAPDAVHFVAIMHMHDKPTEEQQQILACEDQVPRQSLNAVNELIDQFEAELDLSNRRLIDLTRYTQWLQEAVEDAEDRALRAAAGSALEPAAENLVLALEGWAPKASIGKLKARLDELEAVWSLEEPDHHEDPPVLLKLNPFAKLFIPIMKMYNLPNYHELDSTPFFAPFYAVFFGLCVADFGYGALLFTIILGIFIVKRKTPMRSILLLGLVLSFSVMVCGILLDDYFGVKFAEAHRQGDQVAAVLQGLAFFGTQSDAMYLPLLLGIVQVMFGFVLRLVNEVKHRGWTGIFKPIGTFALAPVIFYVVMWLLVGAGLSALKIGPIPLGSWFSVIPGNAWLLLAIGGVFFLILGNIAQSTGAILLRPLKGIGSSLWNMYEIVTGLPGDILSYLRLFALGLAGGLLAEAVNSIALMAGSGEGLAKYLGMSLVLVAGHALNLGLGLLSAFVHSLRLTFVEFYKAMEFRGGGKEYRPLRRQHTETGIMRVLAPGDRGQE